MATVCEICLGNTSDKKRLECKECKFKTCNICQMKYKNNNCISCKTEYETSYLMSKTSKKFVHVDLMEGKINYLVNLEKDKLTHTQQLIDWYKICDELKKMHKYSFDTVKYPDKPVKKVNDELSLNNNYPCPKSGCRGIITPFISENCLICKSKICGKCREINTGTLENPHKCEDNILENLKNIEHSSVQCPKCFVNVFKSEGCNDMRCTNCGCYFNYGSKKMTTMNSNHHYNDDEKLLYAESKLDMEELLRLDNNIRSIFSGKFTLLYDLSVNLHKDLYVSYLNKDKKCEKFQRELENKNEHLRINYLLKKLSEEGWRKKLLSNYYNCVYRIQELNLLNDIIKNIDKIRREILNNDLKLMENETIQIKKKILEFNEKMKNIADINEVKRYNLIFDHNYKEVNLNNIDDALMFKYCSIDVDKMKDCRTVQSERGSKYIELYEYQNKNYENIKTILKDSYFSVDISDLGSGKSFVALNYYLKNDDLNYAIVVTINNIVPKWKEILKTYNIHKPVLVLSYSDLSGVLNHQLKTELLYREDTQGESKINFVNFSVTESHNVKYYSTNYLRELIENGAFLILDEYHVIKKHVSNCSKACSKIMKEIKLSGGNSKILILSGTLFDNEKYAISFFKNLGIYESKRLTKYCHEDEDTYTSYGDNTMYLPTNLNDFLNMKYSKWIGLREIFDFCECVVYKKEKVSLHTLIKKEFKNVKNNKMIVKNKEEFIFTLFKMTILKHLSSKMTVKKENNDKCPELKINNFFYNYRSQKDAMIISEAVDSIIKQVNYDDKTNKIIETSIRMNLLGGVKSLMKYEYGSVDLLHEVVSKDMNETSKKVVVCCNFINTIDLLSEKLKEFNPMVMTGKTAFGKRNEFIKKFQSSDDDRRLILSNFKIISTGIDLDDKFGNHPRKCYVMPNFYAIDLHQLNYRFLRANDTKTDTEIHMIYYKGNILNRVINCLNRKGNIIKDISNSKSELGSKSNVTFFSDIEPLYEDGTFDSPYTIKNR